MILCVLASHSLWVRGTCACTYARARARVRHPSMHVGIPASSSAPSGAVRSDCIAVPHASSPRAACFAASTPSNSCHTGTSSTRSAWSTARSLARYSSRYTSPAPVRARVGVRCTSPSPPPNAPTRAPFVATAARRRRRRPPSISCRRMPSCMRTRGRRILRNFVQHTTCNVQHTTCSIQCATYNVQHAVYNVQHTTCNTQRAAYNVQRTA